MNRMILSLSKKRSHKKESIIRKGDIVKIIEPYKFERCGYPLTLKIAKKIVETEKVYLKIKNKILDVLTRDLNELTHENYFVGATKRSNGLFDKRLKYQIEAEIDTILAKTYLYRNNYGGPERSLYCKYIEELKNIHAKVIGIKFHKTGIYTSGWNYVDLDGEVDYQSAYLADEKTHKILTVELLQDVRCHSFWMEDTTRIEDINVKKLSQKEINDFSEEKNKNDNRL